MKSTCFFHLLAIGSKSRGPLDHFLHYLMQKRKYLQPSSLAGLIWKKAAEIEKDLAKLTDLG